MNRPGDTDDNAVLDAQDDDWAWRRRLRANPVSSRIYRATVAVLGAAVVGFGLFTVPAPGPGWVIVFFGLSIWASEFEWAQRLLRWSRRLLSRWNAGVRAAPWYAKGALGAGTSAVVVLVAWGYLAWQGVPALVPDALGQHLLRLPGVG